MWTILLAILAFSLSLMGTFLVRSGVLTSVHAFAVDPRRGVFILAILIVLIGGALALYALRAPRLQQGGLFAPISREGALVLNNVLLTVACATVLIGTLYPLALEVADRRQDLGRPALLQSDLRAADAAAAAGHAVRALSRLEARRPRRRRCSACSLRRSSRMVGLVTAALRSVWRGPWLAPFGIALGVWIVAGALSEWASRVKLFAAGRDEVWRRARGLPRSAYGTTLAHAGIGLMVLGIVATTAWQSESVVTLKAGERTRDRRLRAHLPRRRPRPGPQLPGAGRPARRHARRLAGHRARARQAPLRRAAPGHHRGRHPRRLDRRPLRRAGR